LVGAIRGQRLSAETKLALVGAVVEAKRAGATVAQACRVLGLNRTRLYRWVRGEKMGEVRVEDLEDRPPVAQLVRHRITLAERNAILEMAQQEEWADLRHRKLAHMLGRLKKVFVSESTVLRALRAARLVAPPLPRRRPRRQRPEVKADGPNQVWRWDISYVAVGTAFWYLVTILDHYSRKIVGWGFFPQATQAEVRRVWDQALCGEGLLDREGQRMPQAVSDRGSQMKAKSIRAFFRDLGVAQLFCRPHTPDDNAEMEAFFATLKCERLYRGSYDHPLRAEADIAQFVDYYNAERLHQGIGFVTPQERHEGRDEQLREQRKRGLQLAKLVRFIESGVSAAGRRLGKEVTEVRTVA
jgi:putative transposase